MIVWLEFLASAAIIVLAATKLAEYGDAIAIRTGLGGMFVGTLLVAGATSLPEILASVSSLNLGVASLAAGNVFGSNMLNMLLLGLLSMLFWRASVLRRVAMRHSLTASLAILLGMLAVFFVMADIDLRIGWVGLDSLILIVVYLVGVWLIRNASVSGGPSEPDKEELEGVPTLWRAAIGFVIVSAILFVATPWLVRSAVGVAEITGLSTGFVGTALIALITSLPELVALIAAGRMGAYDLAVGNLFGSNVFNIFGMGLSDLFYFRGTFISEIDPSLALVGMLGIILTGLGLVGNLVRAERRALLFEIDALLIVVVYAVGLWFVYARGLGI